MPNQQTCCERASLNQETAMMGDKTAIHLYTQACYTCRHTPFSGMLMIMQIMQAVMFTDACRDSATSISRSKAELCHLNWSALL